MKINNNTEYIESFLALLRAGLWEEDFRLSQFGDMDYDEILRLAQEQSVVGLVTAGIKKTDAVPYEIKLRFIGLAVQIQRGNEEMNRFIAVLVRKLQSVGITPILIKGQGVAQCYERATWRVCGDVDFLLSECNYSRAKSFLNPFASTVNQERLYDKHLSMTVGPWIVELHGNLHCGLSHRIDKVLDELKDDVLGKGNVRTWINGESEILLPGIDDDVIFVFVHILQHFFKGGIGIRQICDLTRLLWTYKDTLNHELLKARIRRMGLMSEWKVFSALAVDYLGMPVAAVPLYSSDKKWSRKAEKILEYVLETGNFGHNRDYSFYRNKNYIKRKSISAWNRVKDLSRHAVIFPINSVRFLIGIFFYGISSVLRGE